MKINLNKYVRFKLTPYGKDYFDKYVTNMMEEYHYPPRYNKEAVANSMLKPRGDEYEAQMWELMHVFGSGMWMGNDSCFENMTIEIEEETNVKEKS